MRTWGRQRQEAPADASRCIERMQKALTQMHLQLANVISAGGTRRNGPSCEIRGCRRLRRGSPRGWRGLGARNYCWFANRKGTVRKASRARSRHAIRPGQRLRPRGNVPEEFDGREELYRIVGVDLTGGEGIHVLTAQTVIAEVGYDMRPWETEAPFVSWLNRAPRHQIRGGKVVGRDQRKVVHRAGPALRTAATALLNRRTYRGAPYRRFRMKLGAP